MTDVGSRMWNNNYSNGVTLSRALAAGGICIGVAEVVAPRAVCNMLGVKDNPDSVGTLRVLGTREIAQGICILVERELTPQLEAGIWARVVGDAIDSAFLVVAATKTTQPTRFAAIATSIAAIGVLDLACARRVSCARSQSKRRSRK
jgi:hypothetical protein